MANTNYGDITPNTAGYVTGKLLERGIPHEVLGKIAEPLVIPKNETKSIYISRYESLDKTPATLVEGVTPVSRKLTKTNYTATLSQYFGGVTLSDVVLDTHEDNLLNETVDLLGEQSMQMIETVRYNIAKAGTNVTFANGTARSSVNTAPTLDLFRKAVRTLKRQNAIKLTQALSSTPDFGKVSVRPSYIAVCHPDAQGAIEGIAGFKDPADYSRKGEAIFDSEIGAVGDVRIVTSTLFEPFKDAGGAAGAMITTSGTSADVYPIIIFGKNAFSAVSLRGDSIKPMVVNPKPSDSDPYGQRGHFTWKCYHTALITNDLFMIRLEVALPV